jgi:hypothetical protein
MNTYNTNLIVGCNATGLASNSDNLVYQWDGSSWTQPFSWLNTFQNNSVDALSIFNGNLILGGFFTSAGSLSVNNIVQWNGTNFSPL